MVWVIAFGELFFGDLWCVVWGYGGMRTHFSLLNPKIPGHGDVAWDIFVELFVELRGIEPLTSALQRRRSTN